MPFIAREDGERFVIPSYRDILSAKKKSVLKQEILLLSENYGPFAVMQKKNAQQYEIAFSQDPGYLLGETIWHYLKRPFDLVFCESIPDTNEAMLVVVKSGSVYLDGTFPVDSVAEELIALLTQKNNFDIYVYGDVPISKTPEPGKFSFDSAQVKSFNVMSDPIFPKLPKLKAFQLKLVDQVLKAQGIGVFPIKPVLTVFVLLGVVWMAWSYLTTHKKEVPQVFQITANPYQGYLTALSTPAPSAAMNDFIKQLVVLSTLPGWVASSINLNGNSLHVGVKSLGGGSEALLKWADQNHYTIELTSSGFNLSSTLVLNNRPPPTKMYRLNDVIATIIDRIAVVLPGNNFSVSQQTSKGVYNEIIISVSFTDISVITLDLLGKQLVDLPLNLSNVSLTLPGGALAGSMTLTAVGN